MTDQIFHDDDFGDTERLLESLTDDDFATVEPPADLWTNIQSEIEATEPPSNVVVLSKFRRSIATTVAVGVAAALIAIAGFAVFADNSNEAPAVIASADLSYDPVNFDELGAEAAAHVLLVDENGRILIDIDDADLPTTADESADLELWLIEPDADGNPVDLVSLGIIDPTKPGEYEVPAGYSPDEFFVVDISVEPRDGNADHSGRSILRGPLTSV